MLDFEKAKFKCINYYNNKEHRLIEITPNKAYKKTDKNKINEINKIKSYALYSPVFILVLTNLILILKI